MLTVLIDTFNLHRTFIFYLLDIVKEMEVNSKLTINKQIVKDSIDYIELQSINQNNYKEIVGKLCINNINRMKNDITSAFSASFVDDFVYLLCGFTDDIFISNRFISDWQSNLIETSMFGTSVSGEVIIKRINMCISREIKIDSSELISIYYDMVCCGYSGMYRDLTSKRNDMKKDLYKMLVNDSKIVSSNKIHYLDPVALSSSIKGQDKQKSINYKRIYVLCILGYLLLTCVVVFYIISNFSYYQNKVYQAANE